VKTYVIQRILLAIPTVVLASLIVFMVMRSIPGSIVDIIAANLEVSGQEGRDEIERQLGLDQPVAVQYGRWIGVLPNHDGEMDGLLQGSFGNSLMSQTPVMREIAARWPVTLELTLIGLVVSLLIALPVGMYSAMRQDTIGDYIARSASVLLIAIPTFWIGIMVIVFPSIWWGYMPPITYVPFTEDPWANLKMCIIPGSILGMAMSGTVVRMTRTMMLDVLRQDYIRTAWAKGLSEKVVVMRHALRNALIPVITITGLQLPLLIGESVIVEQIFGLPGLGGLLVSAISTRDYPIVSAILLIVVLLVVVTNTVVDLLYHLLDPRIRYE
jgi:peptide/nickel transport system permease protein